MASSAWPVAGGRASRWGAGTAAGIVAAVSLVGCVMGLRLLLLAVMLGLVTPVGALAGRCAELGAASPTVVERCCAGDHDPASQTDDPLQPRAGSMAGCCCLLILAMDAGEVVPGASPVRDLDDDEPAKFAGLHLRPTPPPPRAT